MSAPVFDVVLRLHTALAVFEESLRFDLGKQEFKVFNVINFQSQLSPVGALKVLPGFQDLADVCFAQANHTGVAVRSLRSWRMVVVDEESLPGALLLSVDFNVAGWLAKPLREAEVLRRRLNRLRVANGMAPWLIEPEKDLSGALGEVCREEFVRRVAVSLGGLGAENAPVRIVEAGEGIPAIRSDRGEEAFRSIRSVGSSFGAEVSGARAPVSGIRGVRADDFGAEKRQIPETGAEIPETGIAPPITNAGAHAHGRSINQYKSRLSISMSSQVAIPESGSWREDGYLMEKLGRFEKLKRELWSEKTATDKTSRLALEFDELYRVNADLVRELVGEMCCLKASRLNKQTQQMMPTNHAAWLNTAVHDKLERCAKGESA